MSRRYDDVEEEEKKSGDKHNSKKAVSEMKATKDFSSMKKEDEFKRYQRWLSFTKPRVVLGFDRLMAGRTPSMSRKLHGLSLAFSKLQGWSLPMQLVNDIDNGDFYVSVRLSLSLCHVTSRTFFGSTWLGSPVLIGEGRHEVIPEVIDFDYPEIVYFTTRLIDPACVGILEVVTSKVQRGNRMTVSQHGCGWTILPLFSQPYPPDVSDGHENVPLLTSCLFSGSPRDLFLRKDSSDIESGLKEMKGCNLNYKLFSHRKLLRAFKIFPENAIIGRFELVAGLVDKVVIPEGDTRAQNIPCIGDTQLAASDTKKNRAVLYLPASPKIISPFTLRIIDWHLLIPNRAQVESRIRVNVAKNLAGKDSAECQIVSRTLKIGIHNGHCLVGGDWFNDSIVEDAEDPDVLLSARQTIDVPSYFPHTHVALVLLIEYEIGVPVDKNTVYDAHRTMETTVKGRNVVTAITLGAAVYLPMTSSGTLVLTNNERDSRDEDKLDVELALRTDEVCGVLSPNPVYNWRTGMRKDEKAGTGALMSRDDDIEQPVLGFDLHAFDSKRKKIETGYSVTAEDKEAAKNIVPSSPDDNLDDLPPKIESGEEKEGRSENSSDDGLERDGGKDRVSGRYHPSKIPKRDEDIESLPDSIVGGDSVVSALRLSRDFYAMDNIPDDKRFFVDGNDYGRDFDDALIPKDKNSLLGRSLQTKLISGGLRQADMQSRLAPSAMSVSHISRGLPVEDDPSGANAGPDGMKRAMVSRSTIQNYPVYAAPGKGASAYSRDLSRGNRARLGRHGFSAMISDPVAPRASDKFSANRVVGRRGVVDIEAEAMDPRALNEISFMFAGYRHGPPGPLSTDTDVPSSYRIRNRPSSVYFTFQFYTCAPTKTESHRLLPADPGQMNILCRDEAHGRDDQPLAYRFSIDCSDSAPLEGIEFAEYLAHCSLQVDLWDADSLLVIGSCMLPLHCLLRQGQPGARCALECDVVDMEYDTPQSAGSVASITVTDNGGPVSGTIVGSINIIAENVGLEGRQKSSAYARHLNAIKDKGLSDNPERGLVDRQDRLNPVDGLNWRALGITKQPSAGGERPGFRAKNIVRARPLTESTPELSKALQDAQRYSGVGPSMKSLLSTRGSAGTHSLNYDDILILFKRFQGSAKGSVQYEGKLLTLLDVPSWAMSIRKLTDAVNKSISNGDNLDSLLATYADSYGSVSASDLKDFFGSIFTRYGIAYKKEELAVLVNKFFSGDRDTAKVSDVTSFCRTEYERMQWIQIGKRLRNAIQKASLSGEDVEQSLAEKDTEGFGYITTRNFKSFLENMTKYGKLTLQEINAVCQYFARRPTENEPSRDPVSLREVMAFLGKEYVGNLSLRLRDAIMYVGSGNSGDKIPRTIADVVKVFKRSSSVNYTGMSISRAAVISDIEGSLGELGVYDVLSHEQVRSILNKAQNKALELKEKFSFGSLLRYIGIEYSGDLSSDTGQAPRSPRGEKLTPEYLLRQVIEHTTQNGVAVDEAFRLFDADGNGSISSSEFIKAFEELKIFNNIPNWKDQIPALVAKFDTSGNGDVSLQEFFQFLGNREYSPNIEQRLTKIFAVAIDSGMTFESIYENFDSDGDGELTVEEFDACLKQLGTFNEVSKSDVASCVSRFSNNSKGTISLAEFKVYFMQRVKRAQVERQERTNRRNIRRFIELMEAAQSKGLTAESVFNHFDKDHNGSLTAIELSAGLSKLPQFESMKREEVESIVAFIADSSSHEISLRSFISFVQQHSKAALTTTTRPRASTDETAVSKFVLLMDAARSKGLSPEKLFSHFDKDGNGALSPAELSAGLRNLPQFKSMTSTDIDSIIRELDRDRSAAISLDEFKAFLNKSKGGQGTSDAVEKFRKLMEVSNAKGLAHHQIFKHFDKDNSGALSATEFVNGLKKLPQFETMTIEDFAEITSTLDTSGDGTVTLEELELFVRPQVKISEGLDDFSQRVQRLFRKVTARGVSLEKLFSHLDRNRNGIFDSKELEDALLKTKAFDDLSGKEIRKIMEILDADSDGNVTFEEFKSFVLYGITKDTKDSRRGQQTDSGLKKNADIRELLLRHLRRISEPDGGIAGLLAFLDRDEDGEVSLQSFMKLLRREGVLDTLKERDILDWLKPVLSVARKENFSKNDNKGLAEEKGGEEKTSRRMVAESKDSGVSDGEMIRVVPLMHLLDGNNPDGGSKEDSAGTSRMKAEQEDYVLRAMPEYEFSNDPEIRALEKKLRGVGHALARKGLDVEGLFRKYDGLGSGAVRRTEFLEILCSMGLYILEKGKALEAAATPFSDSASQQERQIARVRGSAGSAEHAMRSARKFVMSGDLNRGGSASEFQDHLESMALINWYRQSQKHMLIQRVLSHSLASVERIFPRFGKTVFFEYPISNPFSHEERFLIEVNDPELRLVTNLDEWMQLRRCCRPCLGSLGDEPLEADMFDCDGYGHVHLSLLPQETLCIPFTFMTLVPYIPPERTMSSRSRRSRAAAESKEQDHRSSNKIACLDDIDPTRSIEVKIISGTHGHVVANLRVEICPMAGAVDRVFRFFEPENSISKKRIRLVGCNDVTMYPGEPMMSSKYVHCVENGVQNENRVVVEWGPSGVGADIDTPGARGVGLGPAGLDILMRYKCSGFPHAGDFYIVLYNDPYQSALHEVWHIIVHSRQRLDVNSSVGSTATVDLVVRGDRYARRARAFVSNSLDRVTFDPSELFQLVPQSFNRVQVKYSPAMLGSRRLQIHMVDMDSRELISAWVLVSTASAPDVLRQYDVQGVVDTPQTKKIVFQNPWDVPRRFTLVSSNDLVMRPRTNTLDIGPQGSEYLRLWFAGLSSDFFGTKEVFLFLNDESGHSEECFVFRVHSQSH